MVSIKTIAAMCHELNRAYCAVLGDKSQPHWNDAPEWQKKSAIQGVKFKVANPDITPADMHKNWLECKIADGWVYGEVKDEIKKTHPCMVDYDELPVEQQVKDELFSSVVKIFR